MICYTNLNAADAQAVVGTQGTVITYPINRLWHLLYHNLELKNVNIVVNNDEIVSDPINKLVAFAINRNVDVCIYTKFNKTPFKFEGHECEVVEQNNPKQPYYFKYGMGKAHSDQLKQQFVQYLANVELVDRIRDRYADFKKLGIEFPMTEGKLDFNYMLDYVMLQSAAFGVEIDPYRLPIEYRHHYHKDYGEDFDYDKHTLPKETFTRTISGYKSDIGYVYSYSSSEAIELYRFDLLDPQNVSYVVDMYMQIRWLAYHRMHLDPDGTYCSCGIYMDNNTEFCPLCGARNPYYHDVSVRDGQSSVSWKEASYEEYEAEVNFIDEWTESLQALAEEELEAEVDC